MRLIIISDTHGKYKHLVKPLEKLRPDKIIHLGDNWTDAVEIEALTGIETLFVAGNCDYLKKHLQNEVKHDRIIYVAEKKIFLTHGHKYNVRFGIDNLYYKGKEIDADLVLYGHNHVPYILEEDDLTIVNPGSASFPRASSQASIAIVDIIDGDMKISFEKV